MLGASDILGEIHDSCDGGSIKPGKDACLKYGKGVEVPIPGLEKEISGRPWVG